MENMLGVCFFWTVVVCQSVLCPLKPTQAQSSLRYTRSPVAGTASQTVLKRCFCRHYMDSLHICGNSLIIKSKVTPSYFFPGSFSCFQRLILSFYTPSSVSFPVLHQQTKYCDSDLCVTITCDRVCKFPPHGLDVCSPLDAYRSGSDSFWSLLL